MHVQDKALGATSPDNWLARKLTRLYRDLLAQFPAADALDGCDALLQAGEEVHAGEISGRRTYYKMVVEEAERLLTAAGMPVSALPEEEAAAADIAGASCLIDEHECETVRLMRYRTRRPVARLREAGYSPAQLSAALVRTALRHATPGYAQNTRVACQALLDAYQAELDALLTVAVPPGPKVVQSVAHGPPPGATFSDYFTPESANWTDDPRCR